MARLKGNWRGNSICTAWNTACHDESVVYRVAALPDKPGYVSVSGGKIVNGSTIHMGILEFRYDNAARTLVSDDSPRVWRFKVTGEKMDGTLTLADGTEFRRMTLDKKE